MKRPHWEWLAATILGLAAGLTYAWVVAPARNGSTAPASLRSDFKDQFRASIASAYSATGDLERARVRLELLADADAVQALTAQAQRALAAGQAFGQAEELARLASDLRAGHSSIPTFTPGTTAFVTPSPTFASGPAAASTSTSTPLTPSPVAAGATPTVIASSTSPLPTRTPIPSPSAPFQMVSKEDICDPVLPEALMQITVLDHGGQPLPGIEVTLTWDQGEERFFTGFQPEISDGYADYVMQASTSYSAQVARLGVPASGLVAPECAETAGQTYVGGLKLMFRAP